MDDTKKAAPVGRQKKAASASIILHVKNVDEITAWAKDVTATTRRLQELIEHAPQAEISCKSVAKT